MKPMHALSERQQLLGWRAEDLSRRPRQSVERGSLHQAPDALKMRTAAGSGVLASDGQWVKVGVTNGGLAKVDGQVVVEMGKQCQRRRRTMENVTPVVWKKVAEGVGAIDWDGRVKIKPSLGRNLACPGFSPAPTGAFGVINHTTWSSHPTSMQRKRSLPCP